MPKSRLILGDPHHWMQRLSELALTSTGSCALDQEARLREAYALLNAAPAPSLLAGAAIPDMGRFEVLLQAKAYDSAALALFGEDCGMMLSRSSDGQHLASVILPGRSEDVTAEGDSFALAIITALALALCDIPVLPGEMSEEIAPSAMRLN